MNQKLFDFIDSSRTPFHAVRTVCETLDSAGFTALQETAPWQLRAGGKYYVTRNRSAVIAFAVPQGDFSGFLLTASHCDSPTFKVKNGAELGAAGLYTMLNTEPYGGMIHTSWMDRPLGVAGRVLVETDAGLETRLVDLEPLRLVIPHMAIHMNREVNSAERNNPQSDLLPLYGAADAAGSFAELLARAAGVPAGRVAGSELYLYAAQRGETIGQNGEFIFAPRLDDLECAYGTLQGFLQAAPAANVNVFAMLDNEEVGSATKQGADSNFLAGTLERVCAAFGRTREGYFAALASSMMLSADNAHAVHPAHPEKCDPTNRVAMNGGVVVKSHAGQKYTTDAVSAALLRSIAGRAGVPLQWFANRSDERGGSTLGNLSTTQAAVNTVDIGLAQLAMHSCCETAGAKDLESLVTLSREFYSTPLHSSADGSWAL